MVIAIVEYKSKNKTINLASDEKVLFISTDILALIPMSELRSELLPKKYVLLEGKNLSGGILIAQPEEISDITHKCYDARETGIPYTFIFDGVTITFQ